MARCPRHEETQCLTGQVRSSAVEVECVQKPAKARRRLLGAMQGPAGMTESREPIDALHCCVWGCTITSGLVLENWSRRTHRFGNALDLDANIHIGPLALT